MLRQYNGMKEEIKNLKTWTVYQRVNYKTNLSYCLKCKKKYRKLQLNSCED